MTNAQLAVQVTQLTDKISKRDKEHQDWQTGPHDGGPYGDGRYPLTTFDGSVEYHKSPARLQWESDQALTSATGAKNSSEGARDEAAIHKSEAGIHRQAAETARTEAATERQNADTARSHAQTHEANAKVYSERAEVVASAMADFDIEQPWQVSLSSTASHVKTNALYLNSLLSERRKLRKVTVSDLMLSNSILKNNTIRLSGFIAEREAGRTPNLNDLVVTNSILKTHIRIVNGMLKEEIQ